jgi:hypothetical protein
MVFQSILITNSNRTEPHSSKESKSVSSSLPLPLLTDLRIYSQIKEQMSKTTKFGVCSFVISNVSPPFLRGASLSADFPREDSVGSLCLSVTDNISSYLDMVSWNHCTISSSNLLDRQELSDPSRSRLLQQFLYFLLNH